ncbi:YqzH family protein [Niallia sp. JL1B1071]|uniref:YqzH family protein n=1 Tax=Niallia tiangongensis TaxID=3237105 RepID=UPI0037DD8235
MNKLLLQKMIQKTLMQYQGEGNIFSSNDVDELSIKIINQKKRHPINELYDIVQDVVYGYVTDSPYFSCFYFLFKIPPTNLSAIPGNKLYKTLPQFIQTGRFSSRFG